MALHPIEVVWRSALMVHGELFVTINLVDLKLLSFATNLDFLDLVIHNLAFSPRIANTFIIPHCGYLMCMHMQVQTIFELQLSHKELDLFISIIFDVLALRPLSSLVHLALTPPTVCIQRMWISNADLIVRCHRVIMI